MNMTVISAAAKPAESRTRRLLVRMNSTLFYCLGAAVLLEAAAERSSARDGDTTPLTVTPCRAQLLRSYAATVWPEFAWDAACAAIVEGQDSRGEQRQLAGAQAADDMALFYGALSRIAEDGALRRVLEDIAHAEHARREGMASTTRPGPWAAARHAHFMHGYVRHVRDRVVRRAFDLLQQHWQDTPPFPAIDYDAFLERARNLLVPQLRLSWAQRLLYRGWLKARATRGAARVSQAGNSRDTGSPSGLARSAALPRAAVLR